jgi:hypothetical protein
MSAVPRSVGVEVQPARCGEFPSCDADVKPAMVKTIIRRLEIMDEMDTFEGNREGMLDQIAFDDCNEGFVIYHSQF